MFVPTVVNGIDSKKAAWPWMVRYSMHPTGLTWGLE